MPAEINKYTLGEVLDAAAAKYPEKDAVIYGRERVTYRQLLERVNDLAKGFIELGINKGDRIGIWMPDSSEWIYTYFAAAKVGAVSVPINARHRAEDTQYIVSHTEMALLVLSDKAPEIVDYVGMMYEMSPAIRTTEGYKLSLPELPFLKYVVTVGKGSHPGMLRIDDVMELGVNNVSDAELEERQRQVSPEDLAMLQYTSGTTAFPKGCMITHYIIVRNSLACAQRLELIDGEDRWYDPMPPFHILGICYGIIPSLAYGGCRIGTEHFDPLEALKIIETEKCTVTSGFDTLVLAWFNHPDAGKYDLSSLRTGFLAASEGAQRIIRSRLQHWKPLNVYGLSEAVNVSTSIPTDDEETRIRCHGLPHDGLSIKIVNPETGQDLPPGQEGEILCKGFSVMKGYYKDPEATAQTIDRDGWVHSGDAGLIDERSGELVFKGRMKDTVKVGGENVAPAEVEGFLLQHPKVKLAQVVGVPDKKYTEVVATFIEIKPGETTTEQEIIDFCRGKIASFKIPKYVRFVTEWPMSSTKIQKVKLKEQMLKELNFHGSDEKASEE